MLVFMVIQLAGSAGTYPVQLSPAFVLKIHAWGTVHLLCRCFPKRHLRRRKHLDTSHCYVCDHNRIYDPDHHRIPVPHQTDQSRKTDFP